MLRENKLKKMLKAGSLALGSIIFEVSLPSGCYVVDDDNDIVGASSDLSTINDFSFPTCASTN